MVDARLSSPRMSTVPLAPSIGSPLSHLPRTVLDDRPNRLVALAHVAPRAGAAVRADVNGSRAPSVHGSRSATNHPTWVMRVGADLYIVRSRTTRAHHQPEGTYRWHIGNWYS